MAGGKRSSLCGTLRRRRVFSAEQLTQGNLKRCLSLWDLISLGVGNTLGVGVYVLLGTVALNIAGPSVVVSFLLAALAALFAGLCYSELGARIPKAGSAYIYAYVTLGEIVAFVIGWNMILEGLFGTASMAKGFSMYVGYLAGNKTSAWFESIAPISVAPFSQYFDFLAFFLVLSVGGMLCVGVQKSIMFNHVCAAVNVLIIIFFITIGSFRADSSNWYIPSTESGVHGSGGFLPHGVWGMLEGAAVCFYGFVGFDVISFTGEEVREPRRVIPIAIISVLVILFVLYFSAATVVTMMVPYYLQDPMWAVSSAFSYVGLEWATWVVTVGAMSGILASLFGSLFPLPRLLYSMASDGLMFSCLAKVSSNQRTPLMATILPTIVIAVLGAVLDLSELIMMMCLGTLLSYSIVAACVIILRYRSTFDVAGSGYLKHWIGRGENLSSRTTTNIIYINLILFTIFCFIIGLLEMYIEYPLVYVVIFHVLAFMTMVSMALQPQVQEELSFKTPQVPVIPCLSIYVNIQLMVHLNVQTWIRVFIWIAIGIPVYIICVCCFKQKYGGNLEKNLKSSSQNNGKSFVQICVESPTPPGTIKGSNNGGDKTNNIEIIDEITVDNSILAKQPVVTEEIVVQQAYVEDTDEKEANIIDLLDQVLQAEEDSYGEIISLKEPKENDVVSLTDEPVHEPVLHRKSESEISELSDAGSDASMGNQVLSKYDVIAQVHREDLPKVAEEEEKTEKEEEVIENVEPITENEDDNDFNDNDSRTDESGYSDTIDKVEFNDSKEDIPNIPVPPPLDENYFRSPAFRKSYTISARPTKSNPVELEEENKPRESIKSYNSFDDSPMIFGSDKQLHFMSKLNNIFQNKMIPNNDSDEQRRRSNSTGNAVESTEITWTRERPSIPMNLMREIATREAIQNLRPIEKDEDKVSNSNNDNEENSLSRNELKSKLESIFAAGGPKLTKSRLMQSNPPTPEEAYQTDTSSSESITKLPPMEKNDTLKRQKTKFGEVLNSFRLTLNKGDEVL